MHLSVEVSAVRIEKKSWNLKVPRECRAYLCGQLTGKTVQIGLYTSY